MKPVTIAAAFVLVLTRFAAAQVMTIDGKLELKVVKIDRVTQWETLRAGTMEKMTVAASPGHEFVRVQFGARWLEGASGNPCELERGYVLPTQYELRDASGGSVRSLFFTYKIPVGAPDSGCTVFTMLFQESPAGASLTTVRFIDAEVDISKVPGAKGSPGK
jgi:hypothetical protein